MRKVIFILFVMVFVAISVNQAIAYESGLYQAVSLDSALVGDGATASSEMKFLRGMNSTTDGIVVCAQYTDVNDSIGFTVHIGNAPGSPFTTRNAVIDSAIITVATPDDGESFYTIPAAILPSLVKPIVWVTPSGISTSDTMNIDVYILYGKK